MGLTICLNRKHRSDLFGVVHYTVIQKHVIFQRKPVVGHNTAPWAIFTIWHIMRPIRIRNSYIISMMRLLSTTCSGTLHRWWLWWWFLVHPYRYSFTVFSMS